MKEISELEIKFLKLLYCNYEYKEKLNNLNFNIIQNLKNIDDKFELYEKIYEKINKFRFFLNNFEYINSINNSFKIINTHSEQINYLSKLKDGRLISCSKDGKLNIYKNNTFELQLSIKEHLDSINSFTELKDGRIITCSNDKTIKIIKLMKDNKYEIEQILLGHKDYIYKIIEIRKNELISISKDKIMKIWILNNKNKFENTLNIIFDNSSYSIYNILKLNEKEFITISLFYDNYIKFWNLNNYSYISTINNIQIYWNCGNICLLEEDILCIGGRGFYLIQISTHQIIKNIKTLNKIYCINECNNGLFLCSIKDKNNINCIIKYKYEELNLNKIVEKKNAHYDNIYSVIELDDEIIASGGRDGLIKLWSE